MKLAVVLVCLNAASTVDAAVASVVAAGDAIAQLVVVDGGSTDGTEAIVMAAAEPLGERASIVSEPDGGIYDAMNKGIQRVEADYVLFLGADDELVGGGVAQLKGMLGNAVPGMVFADIELMGADGRARLQQGCEVAGLVAGIPRAMPACHQASLYRLDLLREMHGFDTTYRIASDYDLYLRCVESGAQSMYLPVVIARFSLAGLSASNPALTAEEYRRIWVAHGVTPWRARMRKTRSLLNARIVELGSRVIR